jgi:hypothetical protein
MVFRPPTPGEAALRGALGFGAVSFLVYATVAFGSPWLYGNLTEAGAYAFWAALFIVGATWLLGRLLVVPASRPRFAAAFVVGFLAYTIGWIAAYFPLRSKGGELLASVIGPALLAVVLTGTFRRWSVLPAVAAVLIVGHTVGYFLGDALHSNLSGPIGMLLWGVFYGLGFGTAIGWAIWQVQQIREKSDKIGNGDQKQ